MENVSNKNVNIVIRNNYETLSIIFLKLKYEIESVIDGCICSNPPKIELLKAYTTIFFWTILILYQKFWEIKCKEIDNIIILKLASDLYSFENSIKDFMVIDTNFSKNANSLVNIFMKKQYKICFDSIIIILKKECTKKRIISPSGYLITKTPDRLLTLFQKLSNSLIQFTHEYIFYQLLFTLSECYIQYFITIDSIINNQYFIIEKEFLIALTNNCEKILDDLEKIIIEIKTYKCCEEKEIKKAIRLNQIKCVIINIIHNCLSRFVNNIFSSLTEAFDDNFLCFDLKMIVNASMDIFEHFRSMLSERICQLCIETILQFTLYYYLSSFISYDTSKGIKTKELINKLNKDKQFLMQIYNKMLGIEKTQIYLRIISGIITFIEIDLKLLSSTFQLFKEYIGPSFGFIIIHVLLRFRNDVSQNEIKASISQCQKMISKSNDELNQPRGQKIFDQLLQEIKIEGNDCFVIQLNENIDQKKSFIFMNPIDNIINCEIDEDDEVNPQQAMKEWEDLQLYEASFQGMMKKLVFERWNLYYFELKKGILYLFQNKNSKKFQNKILIKNIIQIKTKKELQFSLIVIKKNKKTPLYKSIKFAVDNKSLRDQWTEAIKNEMSLYKTNLIFVNMIEIERRKKMIHEISPLPKPGENINIMKTMIINYIIQENCFVLTRR